MIGAIIGAYKPDIVGAGLQKDAGALHEAVLNELTSKNCTLQVHTCCALSSCRTSITRRTYNFVSIPISY